MSIRVDDRWLWLGLGIATLFALKAIKYAMSDVVRLTQIEHPDNIAKRAVKGEPEDAISLDTLRRLAMSHNHHIADAATQLVIHRFLRDKEAQDQLLLDTTSSHAARRREADVIVAFLRDVSGYRNELNWPSTRMSTPSSISDLDSEGLAAALPARLRDPYDPPYGATFAGLPGWEHLAEDARNPDQQVQRLEQVRGVLPNETAEEPARLWQNRHSMVLHEGAGRVGPEDIIRPRS